MIELREALQMVDDLELQAFRAGKAGAVISSQSLLAVNAKANLKACIEELIVYAAQLETKLQEHE